jgi:hypothetical protein
MEFKSAALGLALVSLALGVGMPVSVYAQVPSAYSFTLQGSSLVTCWYFGVEFSASPGEPVVVQWNENITGYGPIAFAVYIISLKSAPPVWFCDEGPVYVYWNQGAYGTANWSAPSAGGYAVLLVNTSLYAISGTISITSPNATLSPSPIGPATVRRVVCMGPNCEGGP